MKGNEAEYVIPLRKEVMKVPKYDRTKKSVIAVREFLQKHTKSKNVLLGKELNKQLQKDGRKNVVPRVHVKVIKDEDKYKAELIGFPIELEKDKKEKEDKKAGKKVKETPKEEVKETEKEKAEKIKKEKIKKEDRSVELAKEEGEKAESKQHGEEMFRAGTHRQEVKKHKETKK